MRTGIRLAILAFLLTWIPFTLVRGIAMGRQFRIGDHGQDAWSPLFDAIVQIAFVMLAPSMFAALVVFALWAWREERRAAKAVRR